MAPRIALAAGSKLATEAAVEVARAGGNAIDTCLAAAIMGWVTEPFFTSLGGSGFIMIRTPDGTVELIDGNNIMPFTAPSERGQGMTRIFLPDYADGIFMGIGGGSVAVPGVLAAVHAAWKRHGKIEWEALFRGAIDAARNGFRFPKVSDYYLSCTWDNIWSRYEGARALFSVDGEPIREGHLLVQPELADALELIARDGPGVFYEGELADTIITGIREDGGFIAREDFARYAAEIREPVVTTIFGWEVWSNPPPAVGGAVLVHMLALLENARLDDPAEATRAIAAAERAAVNYRRDRYEDAGDIANAFEEALSAIRRRGPGPQDTTHHSTADADGYACSLTESNGYGAGLTVNGIMLNNTLGEEELNPLGPHRMPPGARCHTNMAPTIVGGNGRTVALGSPGADRIVGAIAQTFIRLAVHGDALPDAVTAPRLHVDPRDEGERLCYEPGIAVDRISGYLMRPYDELHMYFGAVQAAAIGQDGVLEAAHDPRRSGGSALI